MASPQELLEEIFNHYREYCGAVDMEDELLENLHYSETIRKSCLFFRDIENELNERIASGQLNPNFKVLSTLKKENAIFTEFLITEREIFAKTNLSPSVSDGLENILKELIDTDLSDTFPEKEFAAKIKWLREEICDEAGAIIKRAKKDPLIKRAVLGASGATIALLNITPPILITGTMAAFSIGAGGMLMTKAADGVVDNFLKRKKRRK